MSIRPESRRPEPGFPELTSASVHADLASVRHRLFAAMAATALGVGAAQAQQVAAQETRTDTNAAASSDALLRKMEAMEQRIRTLEGQLRQQKEAQRSAPKDAQGQKDAPEIAYARGQAAAPAQPAGAKPVKDASAKPGAGKPDWAVLSRDITGKLGPVNPPNSILSMTESPVTGLSIGAYGEVKFGMQQNPAAGGQWQNGFDTSRIVLLPTYAITPNIIFNAEIEFEHAGAGFDADDKLHGTAEIEQVWVDFKIADAFNWRAPGIDLIPIGYINEHHEPTQFYSVNRPELYNGLIPSTWKAGATSVYGRLAEGLNYSIQASSSLEDFGSDFATRTAANTVPAPVNGVGYAPGIDGLNALGFSRPVLGGFAQLSNDIAVAGQLNYGPTWLPGFNGSVSSYYTPNVTPRGAYASDVNGTQLGPLGRSSLTMFDTEFRYRIPDTGWEARGEFVHVTFGNPANLRANNDGDPTNNVGKTMYGYSAELAYHLPLGNFLTSDWEAVPFYRYTYQDTQTGGFAGTDPNGPTGAGQTQFHSAGIAVFPSPQIALKATYQKVINRDPAGANSDSVLGGVGFFF
jgi:hypothetical protein